MAEIVDVEEESGELKAIEQKLEQSGQLTPSEQQKPTEQKTELPEKYRGRTPEELVKMHQEAEKAMSRHAQEVGEVRKLADELLKSQLNVKPKEDKPVEVDFFADPKEAVRQAVDNHPKVLAAEQATQNMLREQARQIFNSKHPDANEIVRDEGFTNWVKSSPIRTQLFQMADAYNVAAADELLTTYKQLNQVKLSKESEADKAARSQAIKTVSVDAGGAGESSKKVFRRADLIRLKLRDPAKYEAMSDEIYTAYAEGRVK